MPINWNGDANSIVTLFIVFSVLKIIENDGKFDTMIHRERPRKSLKNDALKDDDPFSNLATLIYGDFYKKDNRNFIIKGNNSFDTINRRCNGIKRKITDLLDDFQSFSQEKLIERLMNRTDCLNIKNEKKHGSIDERIDLKAVKLIYSTYRDSSIKSETSVIKNDKKKNSRRPPLCPHVVTNRQE
jgi:hypothetical protein